MTLVMIMTVAVIQDVLLWKVSNRLIVAGVMNAVFLQIMENTFIQSVESAGYAFCLLIPGWILLLFSMIGAADLKLLLMAAIYMQPAQIRLFLVLTLTFAFVISLEKCVAGQAAGSLQYLKAYMKKIMDSQNAEPYITRELMSLNRSRLIHGTVPMLLAVLCIAVADWIEGGMY